MRILRKHLLPALLAVSALAVASPAAAAASRPAAATSRPAAATSHPGAAARSHRVAAPHPRLLVSLTFDDGFADQLNALPLLQRHGMHATFYVNSGHLGESGRLTYPDLKQLQAAGNEIGGHTVDHANLTGRSVDEDLREVCDDRRALTAAGLRVTDFAFPYGASDPITQAVVARCGYSSARTTGGLGPAGPACPGCLPAESLPPKNVFAVRAENSVVTGTPIARVEGELRAAAQRGGWAPLVFHNVCDGCSDMAVAPGDLDRLLGWLAAQREISVLTVAQAVHARIRPVVPGPNDLGPEAGLVNGSLEKASVGDGTGRPDGTSYCWERAGYGTNTATWARDRNAHSGSWAETVAITAYQSGDRKLLIQQDSGECAPRVVPGHAYTLGVWYRSTASTRLVVFYRDRQAHWRFWTASPPTPASPAWRQYVWTTPALPSGAERISFGLALAQVGRLCVDDFSLTARAATGGTGHRAALPGIAVTFLVVTVLMVLPVLIRRHRYGPAGQSRAGQSPADRAAGDRGAGDQAGGDRGAAPRTLSLDEVDQPARTP